MTTKFFKEILAPRRLLVTIKGNGALILNKAPDFTETSPGKIKIKQEDRQAVEYRDFRQKAWFNKEVGVHIPGENIHEALKSGAKYWGAKIPGEGQKTYTNLIASACVVEKMPLGMMTLEDERIISFAKTCNGTPGKGKTSGAKVLKVRPMIVDWGGSFLMHVFDQRLNDDVLQTIISYAGSYNGLGDWRPVYGRFVLDGYEEVVSAKI